MRQSLREPAEPPIFIVGCMRSGTSLVSHILDSHSRIAVFYESYLYNYFRTGLRFYGDLQKPANFRRLVTDVCEALVVQKVSPPSPEEIEAVIAAPTFPALFAAVLQLYARSKGKTRAGDKTPDHHFCLDLIQGDFSGSPIVFVMRDPRDTVLSLKRALFYPTTESAAQAWNEAFNSYTKTSESVHLLRYEELVQTPKKTMEALCVAIGEKFEPAMLRFFEKVPDHLRREQIHEKLTRPIDVSSIGNFKQMPAAEIEMVESICGDGLEALGYPLTARRRTVDASVRAARTKRRFVWHRLQYYGLRRDRWKAGFVRWKIALRRRLRYLTLYR
jgi:hypothetical protein